MKTSLRPKAKSAKISSRGPLRRERPGKTPSDKADKDDKADKTQSDKTDKPSSDKATSEKPKKKPPKATGNSAAGKQSPDNARGQRQKASQSSDNAPHTRTLPRIIFSPADSLMALFKWIFYGVLLLLVIFAVWRNRYELLSAISNFGQWLLDFWHNLFGGTASGGDEAGDEESPKRATRRPFADFTGSVRLGHGRSLFAGGVGPLHVRGRGGLGLGTRPTA